MKLTVKLKSFNITEELTSLPMKSLMLPVKSQPSAPKLNNLNQKFPTNKSNSTSWMNKKPHSENKDQLTTNPSRNSTLRLKELLMQLKSSFPNSDPSHQNKKSLLLLLNWTRSVNLTQSLPLCKLPQPSQLNNWTTSSVNSVKFLTH